MANRLSERWRRRQRLKIILMLGMASTVAVFALAANEKDTLHRAELASVDTRFAIRGTMPAPKDIVVVAIDDETFSKLRTRWTEWPRSFHARALRNLQRAGAKAIAYDVQFTEPSKVAADDVALYEAAGRARPVVFATTEVDASGHTNVLGGDASLRRIGARAAQALLPNDPGGVIRRVPYEFGNLKSFAVAAAEAGRGRPLPAPSGDSTTWIDYAGPPRTLHTIPFWRVYQNKFPASAVRGRTVVVGPSAPSLQDVHPTSVAGDDLMSGAEIQANAINTAIHGFPLRSGRGGWDVLAIVLLSVVTPLAALRMGLAKALVLAGIAGAAYLVIAQVAFNHGSVLAVAVPIAALLVSGVATILINYFTETRERRRLRGLFSRFVPEAVVDQVVDRAEGDLRLGGVRLDASVLFCDLRGFTSFAEDLPAEQVIDVLNQYLGEMSEAILDNGGTLVSYMGDGIMAVFGAPLEQDDHADRAVAAALEMAEVRLPRFNAWLTDQGLTSGFRMGVGVNTGPVMSGNVGSERRLEYTTVGDTTNTAARLEGMTKGTPFQIFLSETTRAAATALPDELEAVGEVEIRGRRSALQVWGVPDRRTTGHTAS